MKNKVTDSIKEWGALIGGGGMIILVLLIVVSLILLIGPAIVKVAYWLLASYIFQSAVAAGTIPAALTWFQAIIISIVLSIIGAFFRGGK